MKTNKQLIDFTHKGNEKRHSKLRPTLLSLCMLTFIGGYSQTGQVNLNLKNATVKELFREIEKQTSYRFSYRDIEINNKGGITISGQGKELKEVLTNELAKQQLSYTVSGNKIIVSPAKNEAVSTKEEKVTGKVLDTKGEPVIGATIMEKGTTNGTITDFDGNFTLDVSENATLEVSYVGYQSQRLKAILGKDLTVTLKEDTELLDEVVVVGFGSQKKANLTGAVATVKMDDVMGDRPLTSASNALQGAVPGLFVSNNGNSPGRMQSFKIRGDMSINGGKPLVLIDNVEGEMDNLNPDDIESITVLKDAASSAIYGARAAAGVILITTKRPKNSTDFRLNYNNNFAIGKAFNLPQQAPLENYLNAYRDAAGDVFWTKGETVSRWLELLDQYKTNPSSMNLIGDGIYVDTDGGLYYMNERNPMEDMLENSFRMSHNLSASGGTDKIRYRLSAGMVDHDGVLITDKDSYKRMNFSGFISADVTSWFTQEATFSYAHSERSEPEGDGIYTQRMASYYPEGICPEGADYGLGGAGLPYKTPKNSILYANPSTKKKDNPRIFLKSIIKPIKNLEVVFEYTFDKQLIDDQFYTGSTQFTTIQGAVSTWPIIDYLNNVKNITDYNAINLYATYKWSFNRHNFKAMVGFNQESKFIEKMSVKSYGQSIVDVPSLAGGASSIEAKDSYDDIALRGGFFRVNYNYKDRYLLELNGRYDGSSKFPRENRFGFFPSVSVGWQIAEESFMSTTRDWLSGLKLRASFGEIGNQNIKSYTFAPTMTVNNKYDGWLTNGKYTTAITTLPELVRSNFTWEKVRTLNLGLDFSMFNSRLHGLVEWFQRDTKGMLAPGMQLPSVVGADAPMQNTADMRSRGWEASVNWRDKIGKFDYRLGFNISDSRAKIIKYDSNKAKLLSEEYYEGKELGEIWGYVADGFYTVDDFIDTNSFVLKEGVVTLDGYSPRPGDLKFKNLRDNDLSTNKIDEGVNTVSDPGDRKIIGNSTPRYNYGINLGASYSGFDLSIFLQGTGKRDAWIESPIRFPLQGDYKFVPLYEGLDNYWKPTNIDNGDYTCANPDAEFPRIYGGYGNQNSNYRVSDKFLSDASYLRIKNITLSYMFSKKLVKKIHLSNLKTFISLENLATFSSLPKGIDPEIQSWAYPSYRTFSFGINVTL